jgi:hypothetical protein
MIIMAFINEQGIKISFECSELIDELKTDILEFGGDTVVAVWCKNNSGVTLYTNYDFIDEDQPITEKELDKDEYIQKMTMSALLILLEKQNEIL